jgi:uncharacterized membrane protein YhfC
MSPLFILSSQALVVFGGVAALAILLRKQLPARWSSWFWGGLAWIASQVLRMPLLIGLTLLFQQTGLIPANTDKTLVFLINLVILAGTSGPFEEIARYVVLKRAARQTRGWREAIMFGAGHGSVEALLLIGFGTLQSIILLLSADLVLTQSSALPAEQLAQARAQIDALRNLGPSAYLGGIERAFAICLHIALGVLVTRAVEFGQRRWLALAIVAHIAFNALAMIALRYGGVWAAEGALAIVAVAALAWVFKTRRTYNDATAPEIGAPFA